MRFHISHHEVRRKNMLYYVSCKVDLTEQEKAIIRARNLYNNYLVFKSGVFDYPEEEQEGWINAGLLNSVALFLLAFAVIAAFVSGLLAFILFASAIALGVRGYFRARVEDGLEKDAISIREIIEQKGFKLCGFNNPAMPAKIEEEVVENMELLKSVLSGAARFPGPSDHEV